MKSLANFGIPNWCAEINTHVKHETRKAPQAGRIGHLKIKNVAGQPVKQIPVSIDGPASYSSMN
jgi:hypothetical protein